MTYGTMEKIQTVTITGSTAANIEFTNIPQTYNDLVIYISARSNRATGEDGLGLRLNNITTGYTYRNLTSNGSSVASANTNFEQVWASRIPAANSTGSTFSNNYIHIPNYAGTTTKSYMTDGVTENNGTEAYIVLQAINNSTTSAITSITLTSINASLVQHSTATLYGITRVPSGAKATGGMIYDDANYWYHVFTSSSIFTPSQNITADYMVIAGGGGSVREGGGGAGGARSTVTTTGGLGQLESALSLTGSTNYTITVGAGGAGGASATNGSNSVFSTIISTGGGYGAQPGQVGGSGGGGGRSSAAGSRAGGAASPAGQGFSGGSGDATDNTDAGGGGGGGAGAAGTNGSGQVAGNGGNGIWTVITNALSIGQLSGGNYYLAGGGGGGATTAGTGGLGGGANGVTTGNGNNGIANTGGGASGTKTSLYPTSIGGSGGSGVVIVRYAK